MPCVLLYISYETRSLLTLGIYGFMGFILFLHGHFYTNFHFKRPQNPVYFNYQCSLTSQIALGIFCFVSANSDFIMKCMTKICSCLSTGCWRWIWIFCQTSVSDAVLSTKLLWRIWQCRWNDVCGWHPHVLVSGNQSSLVVS